MPNKIITPVGTKYSVDHDNNASFTDIGGVSAIGDPSLTRDAIDMTDLAATVECRVGAPTLNVGDLTLTVFWDEEDTAGQGLIEDLIVANTICDHQITIPLAGGSVVKTYTGWVQSMGPVNYEVKGVGSREITINMDTTATVT